MRQPRLHVSVRRRIHDAKEAGWRRYRRQESLLNRSSYWLKPRLFMHGNQWCALIGETVQSGVAGFGYTPADAFEDLDRRIMPPLVLEALQRIKGERSGNSAPLSNSPASFLRPAEQRDGPYSQVLYGQNPQDSVAGFGTTLDAAYAEFDQNWFTHTGPLAFMGKRILPNETIEREGVDPAEWIDRGDEEHDGANWWKHQSE